MSLLDLLGLNRIFRNGSPVDPTRKILDFRGAVVVEDDPANDCTRITVGAGEAELSPEAVLVALAAAPDHVDVNAKRIVSVAEPTADDHASTKHYADVGTASAIQTATDYADGLIVGLATTAYVDAEIAAIDAGPAEAWLSLLDVNLTTDAAKTFVDGANTWHGLTWTGLNIASGADSFAVVPGQGLVLDSGAASTDWYLTANSAPKLQFLMSALPGYIVGRTRVRVWFNMECNADANYEAAKLGFESVPYASNARMLWAFTIGQNQIPTAQVFNSNAEIGQATPSNAYHAFCIEIDGDGAARFWAKVPTAAASADNSAEYDLATFKYIGCWRSTLPGSTAFQVPSSVRVESASQLAISIGAQTVNTSNTLVSKWSRLRIEYRHY